MSIEAFPGGASPWRPTDSEENPPQFEVILGLMADTPSPRSIELALSPLDPILEGRGWRAITNRAIERVVGGENASDLASDLLDHIEREAGPNSLSNGDGRGRSFEIIADHLAFWSGGLPGGIGATSAQREAAKALLDELNRQRRHRPW